MFDFQIADWTGTLYQDRRFGRFGQFGGQGRDRDNREPQAFTASQYAYYHEDEDSTFQLVDWSRAPKTAAQKATRLRQLQQQVPHFLD